MELNSELDRAKRKIKELEKKVKLMGDFLQPHELKVVEKLLLNNSKTVDLNQLPEDHIAEEFWLKSCLYE